MGIDACGRAAALATPAFYTDRGLQAIPSRGALAANTVAGTCPAGKPRWHASGGRLPLSRLLQDAIDYARDGTPVTRSQVADTQQVATNWRRNPVSPRRTCAKAARRRPARCSAFPRLPARWTHLAEQGFDDFYRGALADTIAADLQRLGSPLRLADLQRHAAKHARRSRPKHSWARSTTCRRRRRGWCRC